MVPGRGPGGQLPAKALNVGFCDVPHGMTSYCNGLENTDKGKTLSGFGDKKTAGSGGTASGGRGAGLRQDGAGGTRWARPRLASRKSLEK